MADREPQPSDGPDYHAAHIAWVSRQQPVRWRPHTREITLGDVAEVLRGLAARGTTRGSILYCVDKVEWPEGIE
jgi:hypothetical protein